MAFYLKYAVLLFLPIFGFISNVKASREQSFEDIGYGEQTTSGMCFSLLTH